MERNGAVDWELSGMMAIFYVLIGVWVALVCIHLSKLINVSIRSVLFTVFKLYFKVRKGKL